MASRIVEAKVLTMAEEENKQKRTDSREILRLESVFGRYVGHIYTLTLRLLADVRAAEQATVEVFVRLSREMARRWSELQILSRLRELAVESSLARLQWRAGEQSQMENVSHAAAQPALPRAEVNSPTPLDRATLDALTARLPDRLRVAFVLRDREGLSDGAIATHLRVSESEVRRLIHSARLELRRLWLGQ